MRRKLSFAAALAMTGAASLALKTHVTAAPEDQRTFQVTVEGDDGLPRSGHATATLVQLSGNVATYTLARIVDGPSSDFIKGTATVDEKTHLIHAVFEAPVTPGIAGALATTSANPASAADRIKVLLQPLHPSEYELRGTWKDGSSTYRETWKELTRLTSGIRINTPTESGSFGPDVLFDAVVDKADHVAYFVDGWPVERFPSAGEHTVTKRIWQAGWRRFVVKAYDAQNALVGEADSVFLCRGLQLTPEHGTNVTQERIRVEATPIGLTDVATIELRLDGQAVTQLHSAPWGVDMSLGPAGPHTIEAVAYAKDGHELVRTHADLTLSALAGAPDALPLPPTHATSLPDQVGKPLLTPVPANPRNYRAASGRTIDMIVIHKAEGSLDATTSWFQNPRSQVSAHYCVSDTETAQIVKDQNICWHTGNRAYNNRSIGIENAGYTNRDDMTDAHYQRLGKLVAWLCKVHGIPLDRQHVIGHNEVPNPNWPHRGPRWGGAGGHTDPGPYFDWNKLMSYARQASGN